MASVCNDVSDTGGESQESPSVVGMSSQGSEGSVPRGSARRRRHGLSSSARKRARRLHTDEAALSAHGDVPDGVGADGEG